MSRRARSLHQLELFARPQEFSPAPQLRTGLSTSRSRVGADSEAAPRWQFSRPALASPHLRRIRERLELARRYFPELDGIAIRVGLARARGVLGWGSLDAARPGIWVRPRRCDLFTIAHEFTHLLQARRLVPGGEATCDLHALARSAALIDCEPSYVGFPPAWREGRRLVPGAAEVLHRLAREAIAAHSERPRRAITHYRRALAVHAKGGCLPMRGPHTPDRVDGVSEVIP